MNGPLQRFGATTLLPAVLIALAGCAGARTSEDPIRPSEPDRQLREVTVDNRNTHDLRVYVLRGDSRIPLGRVGSLESRAFRLSPSVAGTSGFVRLQVQLMGSHQTHATELIPLNAGRSVEWQVESNLSVSSLLVR